MPKTLARRGLLKGLLFAALLLSGGSAEAQNLLYLEPLADVVEGSQSFEVALKMTFDSPSTGGGVVLAYDPNLLSLDDVAFTPDLSGDEDFQCPGSSPLVSCPNTPGLVAFGSVSGLSGAQTVAILVFTSLSTGTAEIDMTPAYAFGAPGGAEARCAAISGLFTIGNGICNAEHDPKCMTEECAWDGGDCSWWHGA